MPDFDPVNPDFDTTADPTDLKRWRRFVALWNDSSSQAAGGGAADCLSEIDLAAWVEGQNGHDDARRELIEAHLAACPACLAAMLEVRQSLASQADSFTFVASEIVAAAKSLVLPSVPEMYVAENVRFARWIGIARWSGAAAASVLIGVLGWQAGQATSASDDGPDTLGVTETMMAVADEQELPVSELSLGALDDAMDDDEFNLLSLSFDEGSTS